MVLVYRTGMETHYKFRDGEQRKFLLGVASKSGLSTEQLAKIVGFSARNYRDWLREKFAIASSVADTLSRNFNIQLPESKSVLAERWRKMKREAGIVGGYAHFKLYGNPATPEGRIKGGLKALEVCRAKGLIPEAKRFIFPKEYNEDLAEFIGILLGDGGISKGQFDIALNRITDCDYIEYVCLLIKNLFGETAKIYPDKNSLADMVCVSGISIIDYLTKIGMKIGNKVRQQVGVPDWINEKIEFKKKCLRGLMDTDGGIFTHRYMVNGKQYLYNKICFTNQSFPLIKFAEDTLRCLGMNPKVTSYSNDSGRVWLYNQNDVEKYLKVVGSSNTRLLVFSRNWRRT